MRSGRGSSSSSTVLAEAIRLGTGPAAIVLAEPDPILAVGAMVAETLYGRRCAIVVLSGGDFDRVVASPTATISEESGRPVVAIPDSA
jgi:predicted aconitase with swiveling domain